MVSRRHSGRHLLPSLQGHGGLLWPNTPRSVTRCPGTTITAQGHSVQDWFFAWPHHRSRRQEEGRSRHPFPKNIPGKEGKGCTVRTASPGRMRRAEPLTCSLVMISCLVISTSSLSSTAKAG